jgi:hypothetical protein
MVFAAMQFASGIGGLAVLMLEIPHEKLPMAIGGATFFIVFPTVFFVGRWVGRRGIANGLMAVFLIGLVARIGASLLDVAVLSRDELTLFFGDGFTALPIVGQMASGVVLFFVLGALGYWRGRRQRLGSYLGYLLVNVPDASRHAIVDLAFEEARRASGSTTNLQPSHIAADSYAARA